MKFDKSNEIKQISKTSETVLKFLPQKIENSDTSESQKNSEPPEEIFRGLFFIDEQYQERGCASWQLFG